MHDARLVICVLAAGKGTRMRSELPKVMHRLAGQPLLQHVLTTGEALAPSRIAVVVGPDMPSVAAQAGRHATVVQERQLGTGDAVRVALPVLAATGASDILVVYGDTPLIRSTTLNRLIACRRETGVAAAVLGMRVAEPNAYGRLVCDADGDLLAIVEASEASAEEQAIELCKSGVMVLDAAVAGELLARLEPGNSKGEYYLTDVVQLARSQGMRARVVEAPAAELAGVNTRADLATVEATLQARLRADAMAAGVTLSDPATVYLSADTHFGTDVVVGQHVVFGSGVVVEDQVEIKPFCHLEGAILRRGAVIGPFARLRPGTEIGPAAHVGNFVEIKNTKLGGGAKANHLSYLGDATIGERTNVGAGTITCNYDGFEKFRTIVGADVFIGSDAALVAPVTVGDRAMIAAGSIITRDVASDALAIARGRQVEKQGYAARFRDLKRSAQRKS
jgi:bifunctional UDP-N-acetylglucosamine pyrophosphorylase/glucosamine-1-phosphate N-acetyltransferase